MNQNFTFTHPRLVSLLGPSFTGGIAAALAAETLRRANADADAGRFLSAEPVDFWFAPPTGDR